MSDYRFFLLGADEGHLFAKDALTRELPSGDELWQLGIEARPASSISLYPGGREALAYGLNPEYAPAQELRLISGRTIGVVLSCLREPAASSSLHEVAYWPGALGGRCLAVLFDPQVGERTATHTRFPFPVTEPRWVCIARRDHPRVGFERGEAWWARLLDSDSFDLVAVSLNALLPELETAAFGAAAAEWCDWDQVARLHFLVWVLRDCLHPSYREAAGENTEVSVRDIGASWPWQSYPCTDEPHLFGAALDDLPVERGMYAINGEQLAKMRQMLLPCGRTRMDATAPSDEPFPVYRGALSRCYVSGVFRLGRNLFGVVQSRGGLKQNERLRSTWLPGGGPTYPVAAELWKRHDHRHRLNPEIQKGIGLIHLNANRHGTRGAS